MTTNVAKMHESHARTRIGETMRTRDFLVHWEKCECGLTLKIKDDIFDVNAQSIVEEFDLIEDVSEK